MEIMKTNEAPEKIYVKITHPISDEYTEIIAFEDGKGIEYTRTNAFIKKAIEWIDYNNRNGGCNFDEWKKDFKNYMKGE